jgi:hypothetical protein
VGLVNTTFPKLRHLTRLGIPNLKWLSAPWVQRLESLHITDARNVIASEDAVQIANVVRDASLKSLSLGEWIIGTAGSAQLGEALSYSQIEFLNFSLCRLPAIVLTTLFTQRPLLLRGLALTGVDAGKEFLQALAATPTASALSLLWLNRVDSEGLKILADSRSFVNVESLRLALAPRDLQPHTTLTKLLDSPHWSKVRSLTLYVATQYGDENLATDDLKNHIVETLVQCDGAQRLEELRLDLPGLTLVGARQLANIEWPMLRLLTVRCNDKESAIRNTLEPRFGSRLRIFTGASYM